MPFSLRGIKRDGLIEQHARWSQTMVDGGGIHKGFKRGPGLPDRLQRPVELAFQEIPPTGFRRTYESSSRPFSVCRREKAADGSRGILKQSAGLTPSASMSAMIGWKDGTTHTPVQVSTNAVKSASRSVLILLRDRRN
jgi:hypothetical protein